MEEKPFKFDAKNPRLVTNVTDHTNTYRLAGAILLASLYIYNRRTFRID